ncbi:hypothetical protein ONS95_012206 [Cadophora gregata]|uniref:uncharacterized protein n=1 Tax=Cadophora gregata TaxID=51156 RepID=UPI0026DAD4ED|nr:uncharacterized protein ONS95_012206 [Cadophora gregata]KAK0117887.1 hypothetical protein ONS95_012206 [Cadophora gregata]KAK0122947.1 hypothetical protein ONS96_009970 [Cadophora gregata f. sp. sojae]
MRSLGLSVSLHAPVLACMRGLAENPHRVQTIQRVRCSPSSQGKYCSTILLGITYFTLCFDKMDSLDFPLSTKTKRQVLAGIGNCKVDSVTISELLAFSDSFFSYYERALESSRSNSLVSSHLDIIDLLAKAQQKDGGRSSVEEHLRQRITDNEADEADEIIEDTVDLALRLVLMVPTGGFSIANRSVTLSGGTKLNWKDGSVHDLVKREFPVQNSMKEPVKLERIFNARNLERIAGVEVRWTSNLADHLRMRDDDKAVEIFHYATFLKLQQDQSILPSPLVDETLRTLALLLPEHDKDIERWFSSDEAKLQKRRKLPLDPLARECGQLKVEERQIDNFQYWHDRLVILKQVFDEAEPRNIKQWWRDRRRRVQWYTFWVAAMVLALTVFFGTVQSVEGAMQVWLAMKDSK